MYTVYMYCTYNMYINVTVRLARGEFDPTSNILVKGRMFFQNSQDEQIRSSNIVVIKVSDVLPFLSQKRTVFRQ